MMTQLNPPIPLDTPKGKAWAVALVDYGPQWDLQWVTFIHDTGECWTFRNPEVRQGKNYTFGLGEPTPFHKPSTHAKKGQNGHANGHNGHMNGAGKSDSHSHLASQEKVN